MTQPIECSEGVSLCKTMQWQYWHASAQWITCNYGVIHKTGSKQCIANLPKEDWAVAISNMHQKFDEDRTCSSRDMLVDRHKQTDMLITILYSPISGGVKMWLSDVRQWASCEDRSKHPRALHSRTSAQNSEALTTQTRCSWSKGCYPSHGNLMPHSIPTVCNTQHKRDFIM